MDRATLSLNNLQFCSNRSKDSKIFKFSNLVSVFVSGEFPSSLDFLLAIVVVLLDLLLEFLEVGPDRPLFEYF